VSEGANRNVPATNTLIVTLVQLLALYTNPDSQNAQRQTDRETDDRITPAVPSAKKPNLAFNVIYALCQQIRIQIHFGKKHTDSRHARFRL